MLKNFRLDEKSVPVPVPVRSLAEAMEWIERTFLKKNTVITRACLDGADVLLMTGMQKDSLILSEQSRLEISIESPRDLSVQTLDAVRDMCNAILRRLQPIAVRCWEVDSDVYQNRLRELSHDIGLISELIDHTGGMLDYGHREMAPVLALGRLIRHPLSDLEKHIKSGNWKQCSHVLLTRIESLLEELSLESEQLQLRVLSSEEDDQMVPEARF